MKESFYRALSFVPSGVILCNTVDGDIKFANNEAYDSIGVKSLKEANQDLFSKYIQ
jgi:hypothetical protein